MNERVLGILKFALAREIDGMKFYKERINSVKDPNVKEIFEQLSEMEDGHVTYINQLIERFSKGESISEVKQPVQQDVNLFENREKKELVGGKMDDMVSDLSVLRMAYLIEDDFMNFYKKAAEKAEDPQAQKILNSLAAWEKEHRDMLYELYQQKSEEYWNDMGFAPLF